MFGDADMGRPVYVSSVVDGAFDCLPWMRPMTSSITRSRCYEALVRFDEVDKAIGDAKLKLGRRKHLMNGLFEAERPDVCELPSSHYVHRSPKVGRIGLGVADGVTTNSAFRSTIVTFPNSIRRF